MANKKINELDSRASLSLSDLMAVGDPSTGYLYKTTISDLKTLTGAGVVSFNGRFGSVVPAEGDYSLTQLSDVIITSVSNNQVLRYNGSNWVNATIDLSGYVPYTGATGNVNLGSNTLLAAQIKATSSAGLSINANSGTQIADLGAGGGANMTLFGGLTGTSASFSSSVTGNTIVKTGGTSSQFLKADGSVDSSTYLTTSSAASTYVPLTRTLTINGTTYDLSADRTWTIPTHDAVTIGTANGLSLSGQVLSLALSSTSATGALSSTDWNTFNGKQAALNGTGFVKISGTTISYDNTSYLPLTGGTLTGDLAIRKTSGIATLNFINTGSQNDTGFIQHQETTVDLSVMRFSVSDNDIATDYFVFGNTDPVGGEGFKERFKITGTGIVTLGTWNGTSITDTYISSAATWNAKIGGSGTTNYLSKFTASGTIGNSVIYDDGTNVTIGGTASLNKLTVQSGATFAINTPSSYALGVANGGGNDFTFGTSSTYAAIQTWSSKPLVINGTGTNNVLIGTTTDLGTGYRLQVDGSINATGTLGNISVPVAVDYLVVGGGGGGGADLGGGGGAGGFLAGTTYLTKGTYSIVQVGKGGYGGTTVGGSNKEAISGQNSSIFEIISYGGGGGGNNVSRGKAGASGGGGSREGNGGGDAYLNQGRVGGNGGTGSPYYVGGGGGGADADGGNGTTDAGGNGGIGKVSDITGTSTYYAGGGGGAGYGGGGGTGGLGGGGNGSSGGSGNTAGTANTGGGGGGGGNISGLNGSNGGSGIVIIKYSDTYPASTCTGTFTYSVSGGFRRYIFTGNGTIKLMA
jgi:hypothetical protein